MDNHILNDIQVSLSDLQLERAVLGAMLTDSTGFGKVKDILTPDIFSDRAHAAVYAAIRKAGEDGEVDLLTVTQAMRSAGTLDLIGGPAGLVDLSQAAATAAHIATWAATLADKHNRRHLLKCLNEMTVAVMDESASVDGTIQAVRTAMDDFARQMVFGAPVAPASEGILEAYRQLTERVAADREGKSLFGIPTGLVRLDRAIGGLKPGCLYILAARPAMGKTAMMLHLARTAAEAGKHAVVFSLEMAARQIGDRLILAANDGYVLGESYNRGHLNGEELSYIDQSIDPLTNLPIYLDDCGSATLPYIHSKARKMRDEGRCDVVLIDYLQLISAPDVASRRNSNREQEVAQMSRQAKALARDLDIPVVLLSQLNRAVEQRGDKRPQLADLRESGAIEQDADVVMFLHRAAYYGVTESVNGESIPANSGEVIIAKNRHGHTGAVPFLHNESITKIYDYEQ